mgnify:CR=1 FL=1
MSNDFTNLEKLLERIAAALEQRNRTPGQAELHLPEGIDAFIWEAGDGTLVPVPQVAAQPLALLKGIAEIGRAHV